MSSGREGIGRGRGRGVRRENQPSDRREHRRPVEAPFVDEKQFHEATTSSGDPSLKGASNAYQTTVLHSELTNASNDLCKTSKLSVDAKEFYPKGYVPQQNQNVQVSGSSVDDRSGAKSRMCELMDNLTRNPGEFDQSLTPLKETFNIWLQDPHIVHSVVDAIIEQSVTETNFRYNGARLCSFLYNVSSSLHCSEFRTYLISRCTALSASTDSHRILGFAIFLAELFMQLETAQGTGQRIAALGEQLIVLLEVLVSQAVAANSQAMQEGTQSAIAAAEVKGDNLKCVCQALKLAGWQLEEMYRQRMNQLTKDLARAAGGHPGEKGVRRMVTSVVELRRVGWGRSNSSVADPTASLPPVNPSAETISHHPHQGGWQGGGGGRGRGQRHYHSNLDEPVFYGPDGQILTAEESRFLQDSIAAICDDEDEYGNGDWGDNWSDGGMDEEMEAAFEQFLQLGQKSTTA